MIPPFNKATLFEKQQFYYNGSHCTYCGRETDLVDSLKVYQESHGLIYYCAPCQAWVGVKYNSDQALGPVAKKPLRKLRSDLYELVERFTLIKMGRGESKIKAQKAIYAWMAGVLNIETCESHCGYFNEDQCTVMIEELTKYLLTPAQKAEAMLRLETHIKEVILYAEDEGIAAAKFQVAGLNKIEFRHPVKNKIFNYFPITKTGAWEGVKKINPIPDITEFLQENFKAKPNVKKKSAGNIEAGA